MEFVAKVSKFIDLWVIIEILVNYGSLLLNNRLG